MDDAAFDLLINQLDGELVGVPDTYGIKMGYGLFDELRDRGLLQSKTVDMVLWSWNAPAYKGHPALPEFDLGDYDYKVGQKKP